MLTRLCLILCERPFLIFGSFALLVSLGLVLLIVRLLRVRDPRVTAALLPLPLLIPAVAYVLHCLGPGGWHSPVLATWIDLSCFMSEEAALKLLHPWPGIASIAFFVAGTAYSAAKGLLAWNWLRHLPARLLPADHPLRPVLDAVAYRFDIPVPAVYLLPDTAPGGEKNPSCSVVGVWRPRILLKESILERLEPAEVRGLLAHEMAHIARGDVPVRLLTGWLRSIMLYVPATGWLLDRTVREQEKACDAAAAAVVGVQPLARALVKTVQFQCGDGPLRAASFSVLQHQGVLSERLTHLLELSRMGPSNGRILCWRDWRLHLTAFACGSASILLLTLF